MPESDDSDRRKPRSAREAAERVLALLSVIGKVHDPERSTEWVKRHGTQRFLSPAEAAFVNDAAPTEQARIQFSWRAEAMVSILWALRGLAEMPPLGAQCPVFDNELVKAALKDPAQFVAAAQLRSAEEISAMEQFLYRQHWRVRDAQFGGLGSYERQPDDPPIEELHPGIVQERRYGLSWLVGWGDDWDNVPLDT